MLNGERYLDATLQGIRAQTFQDCELVLSDNASTDRTATIIRDHAVADRQVSALIRRAGTALE